ncbi:MAG: hypothetical protein Q7S56_02775 [Nanoarchaeota archaeon]|nr:hypothetical protein [Nanoarchaeota archaeon]
MEKKGLVIFCSLLLLVVLITFISADSCSIKTRAQCSQANGKIVFGLSSSTNAHVEVSSQFPNNGTAPYVFCCDFASGNGIGNICNGDDNNPNIIIREFAPGSFYGYSFTNGHAEIPDRQPNIYGANICYGDLSCISSTSSTAPAGYPIIIDLSLSSATNAHVGPKAAYPTGYKIYCKHTITPPQGPVCGNGIIEPAGADGISGNADDEECDLGANNGKELGCSSTCKNEYTIYWAEKSGSTYPQISTSTFVVGSPSNVYTVIVGNNLNKNNLKFEIYQKGDSGGGITNIAIRTGSSAITSTSITKVGNMFIAQWDINTTDIQKFKEYPQHSGDNNGIYNGIYFVVKNSSGSQIGNPSNDLSLKVEEITATPTTCADYADDTSCNSDKKFNQTQITSSGLCTYTTQFHCSWSSGQGCLLISDLVSGTSQNESCTSPPPTCSWSEAKSGDCNSGDGYITVSYNATGTNAALASCQRSDKTIACSTISLLPVFDWSTFSIAVIIIVIIYGILLRKK